MNKISMLSIALSLMTGFALADDSKSEEKAPETAVEVNKDEANKATDEKTEATKEEKKDEAAPATDEAKTPEADKDISTDDSAKATDTPAVNDEKSATPEEPKKKKSKKKSKKKAELGKGLADDLNQTTGPVSEDIKTPVMEETTVVKEKTEELTEKGNVVKTETEVKEKVTEETPPAESK